VNERTLSSAQTFFMKFIFPTIWISMFGLGTLALFLGVLPGMKTVPPRTEIKWFFLAAWLWGTFYTSRTCLRLKRVRIDESSLYVSNYIEEIRIPLEEIADVTENRWTNIHPVTIHLRSSTSFGDRIVFMPRTGRFAWRSHPVVTELRDLIRR
jgi:hypothetical protein